MTTVDKIEIEKFSKLAKDWWNPNGKFKPLHLFNPARISFIKDKLISHFTLNPNSGKPLEKLKIMTDTILANHICKDLIQGNNVIYEEPGITELEGEMWKGKADVVNHKEDLVIDLKTTADINKFRSSAFRYNYDSQAFIYKELFGYDFIFIAIDKTTKQIGIFECSDEFLTSGYMKLKNASKIYDLFYKDKDFDPEQYFISETL